MAAALFHLSTLSCLNVVGAQASLFLQGQLTCDLKLLSEQQACSGAICDLKGRVVAILDVVQWDHQIKLIFPTALLTLIEQHLTLPARLSRVQFIPDHTIHLVGLHCPVDEIMPLPFSLPSQRFGAVEHAHLYCYQLLPAFYMLMAHDLPTFFPYSLEESWHNQLLKQGFVFINLSTSGQFVAQRLALDQTGRISFNKGCYKGQEIIARLHYKGVNKYELRVLSLQADHTLLPGQPIFSPTTQQQVGEIVDVGMGVDHHLVLASLLKTAHAEFVGSWPNEPSLSTMKISTPSNP